jgi:hypothetical protein
MSDLLYTIALEVRYGSTHGFDPTARATAGEDARLRRRGVD